MSVIVNANSPKVLPIEDIPPPWNAPLCGRYMRSFAYVTMKDRLPLILTKVIEGLSSDEKVIATKFGGEEGKEDLKSIISSLLRLKNDLVTDQSFTPLEYGDDCGKWNAHLRNKTQNGTMVSWFQTDWLYAECYFYRRIYEAFLMSKTLAAYDPFHQQKKVCLEESLPFMNILANHVLSLIEGPEIKGESLQYAFQRILKQSLWANKIDLSLKNGEHMEIEIDPLKVVDELNQFILVDESKNVYNEISKSSTIKGLIIDIVLDNAGYELLVDLCFAEFMMSKFNVSQIRFHCKAIPWFLSDVMEKDFLLAIKRLSNYTPACQQLAAKWRNYLNQGKWRLLSELFWTSPFGYNAMEEQDPKLYSTLQESSIVIFKGDLNYRKLLGDINWKYSTPFHTALQGFNPAPVVALRSAKADLIAGLDPNIHPVEERSTKWFITGDYGMVQFDGSNSKNNL